MTVTTTTNSATFNTNGVTTVFPFGFRFLKNSDIRVAWTDAAGTTSQLTEGTDYVVSGAGNESGGSVTTTGAAFPAGTLGVQRILAATQLIDLRNQGAFFAETHEAAFDYLTMLIQQNEGDIARALTHVLGSDWYDAAGKGIRNVSDPVEDMDVANKRWVSQFLATLIGGLVIGPVGAAAAVTYTSPDGQLHTVQEMSGAGGAELIGFDSGTVDQALRAVAAQSVANNAATTANSALLKKASQGIKQPAVIDMHFGTLAGQGWNPAEVGGNQSTTTTAAVAQNLVDIPVANAAIFAVDQLICFAATDGQLYSAIIRSKSGNTIRIDRQLPVSLASGAGVYGFYRDDAHPNIKGAATIVDDAMRQLSSQLLYEVEYRSADGAIWTPISGATVTSLTTTAYNTPGGSAVADRAVSVYSTTAGAGVQTRPVALVGGDYVTNVVVNPGLRDGGFSGLVDVSIVERLPDGSEFTIAYRGGILSYNGIRSIELPYSARPGSLISVRIISTNAGGFTFYAGAVTHKRVSGYLADINRGKHVLLGDSWFTSGGDFHNALVAKLNKAQVISKGVPGNRASQLLERFDADVAAESPDYVWVMVGTNDYYANVSPALFDQQINQLRSRILAIGAQPIFFTPSVGATAPTAGGGDQLAKSRAYALRVSYAATDRAANGAGCSSRSATFNVHGISVPAGGTVLVGVIPGQTRLNGVVRFAAVSGAGLQLVFDYPSTVDGAGAVDALTVAASTPVKDAAIPRVDTNLRYIAVRVKNPTGTAVPTSVIADICWTHSEG